MGTFVPLNENNFRNFSGLHAYSAKPMDVAQSARGCHSRCWQKFGVTFDLAQCRLFSASQKYLNMLNVKELLELADQCAELANDATNPEAQNVLQDISGQFM